MGSQLIYWGEVKNEPKRRTRKGNNSRPRTYLSTCTSRWHASCFVNTIFSGYCTRHKCFLQSCRCFYAVHKNILSSREASREEMHRAQERRISRCKIQSTFHHKLCPLLPSFCIFRKSVHGYSHSVRWIGTADIIWQPSNAILPSSTGCRASRILRLRHLHAVTLICFDFVKRARKPCDVTTHCCCCHTEFAQRRIFDMNFRLLLLRISPQK